MTSGRLLFVLLIVLAIGTFATSASAADEKSQSQISGAQQNQSDSELFGLSGADKPASDLFFLNDRPRLNFSTPVEQSRSAVLNERECYTMRMYKVKHKERFKNGENGLRSYTTCELASNYQMRTAIAHVRTNSANDSQSDAPQK